MKFRARPKKLTFFEAGSNMSHPETPDDLCWVIISELNNQDFAARQEPDWY